MKYNDNEYFEKRCDENGKRKFFDKELGDYMKEHQYYIMCADAANAIELADIIVAMTKEYFGDRLTSSHMCKAEKGDLAIDIYDFMLDDKYHITIRLNHPDLSSEQGLIDVMFRRFELDEFTEVSEDCYHYKIIAHCVYATHGYGVMRFCRSSEQHERMTNSEKRLIADYHLAVMNAIEICDKNGWLL